MFVKTLFACPVYQNYAPIVAAGPGDHVAFAAPRLKDNKLMLDVAEKSDAPMPFGSVVHDRMVSAIARGAARRIG